MIPHPHVKNSKLLLGKAGVITTIEEESPPPPPKHDDKVKPGVRKNEEKKFEWDQRLSGLIKGQSWIRGDILINTFNLVNDWNN